jgi:hypothetical protein
VTKARPQDGKMGSFSATLPGTRRSPDESAGHGCQLKSALARKKLEPGRTGRSGREAKWDGATKKPGDGVTGCDTISC